MAELKISSYFPNPILFFATVNSFAGLSSFNPPAEGLAIFAV
jgi:hypothetical protein